MKCHALMAEDEPRIRSMLRDLFEDKVAERLPTDYVIYEAGDSNEASAKVAECQAPGHSLDMVIPDLLTPRKSGFEVLPGLVKVLPTTPVVVLSATADFHAEKLQGLYGSIITVMAKPVRLAVFVETVKDILLRGDSYG